MVRMILWVVVLAAAGGVCWFLCGDDQPSSPAYGPLAEGEGEDVTLLDGPGLMGREGGAATNDELPVADGKAHIRGVVLDASGMPMTGVRVGAAPHRKWQVASNENQRTAALAMFEPLQGVNRKPVAFATTEPDGTFRIDGLEDTLQYSLIALVEAPQVANTPTHTARVTLQAPVRIVVGEGSALRGRVVDASGTGVQADVTASSRGGLGGTPWMRTYWAANPLRTGTDGRFTMPAVPNGTLNFTVHVPGVGKRSGILVETPTTEEVLLQLAEADGAVVEGRVTDTNGMPIEGAKISVNSGPDGNSTNREMVSRAAVSAKDGTYKVTGLNPGTLYGVNAYAEGYVPTGNLANQMPLAKDRVARVDVILIKGVTIKGRVLSPEGTPIGGAEVAATNMGQGSHGWFAMLSSTTSAADGSFTLENVAIGSGLVQARLEGHFMPPADHGASNPYPWMQTAMQGTPYEAKEEGQVFEGKDVVLAKGTEIVGLVVDENDAPLSGALVTAARQSQGWSPGLANLAAQNVRTDGEGRFTFIGLEPDKTWNFSVRTETHITEKPVPVQLPKEGPPKEEPKLVAKAGATIAGVVTMEGGEGIAGVGIQVQGATPERTYTAADGTFELAGLMPGTWSVMATGIQPTPEGSKHKVTLEWGKHVGDIELTVPPVYTIAGTVEDEQGEPLPGISVRAVRKTSGGRHSGNNMYATTGSKGAFLIKGLLEGEYSLYAANGKEEGVSTGATDVRIVASEKDRFFVEGSILDADNQPVVRGSVRVYTGPSGKRRSSVNAPITGGRFLARVTTDESAVDVEVTAAYDAMGQSLNFIRKREKDISLSGTIEIRLDEGMTVSGTVRASNGDPLAGMNVRVQKKGNRHWSPWGNQHGGNGGQARSGEDGSWTVKGLKDGDYTVELTPGGDWMSPPSIPVRAGEKGVEIKLQKGLTIEGRVLTPDGEPVSGANVWLNETAASKKSRGVEKKGHDWMSSMRLRTTAGTDGRFVVKGLPEEGLFNVSAGGNGAQQPYVSDTIKDVAAGTKTVEIRLREGGMIEGQVVGPNGEAVGNAWIRAQPVDSKAGLNHANTHLNGRSSEFKLGPMLPGRYKLTVQVHGGSFANPEPVEVSAPATGIKIQLKKTLTLSGTVVGSNVQGFSVQFAAKGGTKSGQVGADGSWTIKGATDSVGTLYAFKRGDERYAKLENVGPGRGPFDLQLFIGESIRGRIDGYDPEKRKPNVYAHASGRWIHGTVNDDGTWEITGLPPGEYNVQGWVSRGKISNVNNVQPGASEVTLTVTYR